MIKAAAPIIGGIICPPVEAEASTPPANSGLYPTLFINGMVNVPVPATFAKELPEIVPINPLARTAAFAGPPLKRPVREKAKSIKACAPPVSVRNAPRRINRNTKVAVT
ncbi:hypothetical protein SDC9_181651 [bioreactor metagenome]|uniref:Uncharacterized protein n=1 Tax=bioreactor metagenome TaxID=1076179 RepID=A0A645H584_9ZZZZ